MFNKIKHFTRQSWLLIVASFCFGLLIAVTNSALSPRIEKNQADKLSNLMRQLISDAENFDKAAETVQITTGKGKVIETDIYRAFDKNKKNIGFAFIASGAGFADKIKLVIAVDKNCEKFFGFEVLSSNETPGFGDRIKEDYFRNQFKQAPAEELELVKTGRPETIDNRIVAISGATVSSEAVVKIFNTYINRIKEQIQTKGLSGNDQ